MPLHVIQPELEKHGHRVGIFNALGNGFDVPLLGGADDPVDCILHRLVGHQGVHQFAVDLDVIGLQQVEDLKARLVDTIMFDCKTDAEFACVFDQRPGLLDVLCRVSFRYLYDQSRAIEAVLVQLLLKPGSSRWVGNGLFR